MAIVTLSNRGISLARQVSIIYRQAARALKEDYTDVRTAAMEVIFLLGSNFPNYKVASPDDATLNVDGTTTLVNDVFTKLCSMVRDQTVAVRTRALVLIGSLHGVSTYLLMQTFAKMHLYFNSRHISGRKYHFEIQNDSERRKNRLIKSLREKYESELRYTSSEHSVGDALGINEKDEEQLLDREKQLERTINAGTDSIEISAAVTTPSSTGNDGMIRQIKHGGDNPDGDLNVDQILQSIESVDDGSLNNDFLFSGAVGTFILGLEDEYQEVRLACVEAISRIGGRAGREFSDRSLQYLIDMFGDEIDAVRIKAIDCLSQLSRQKYNVQGELQLLQEEQLTIALTILEDANPEVRYAIHRLLCNVGLPNANCLHATVSALLQINLRKFLIEDKEAVFSVLKALGERHSSFVSVIVERLLDYTEHRSMLHPERNIEDTFYTCVMIVLYNGYLRSPQIGSILPEHILRDHFPIFQSKHALYFPTSASILQDTTTMSSYFIGNPNYQRQQQHLKCQQRVLDAFSETFESIRTFVQQKQSRQTRDNRTSPLLLRQLLKRAVSMRKELRQAASSYPAHDADLFSFLDSFFDIVMLYMKTVTSMDNVHTRQSLLVQCFNKSYDLQFRYNVITDKPEQRNMIIGELKLLRLMCLLQWWLSIGAPQSDSTENSMFHELQARVRDVQQYVPKYRASGSVLDRIHGIAQRIIDRSSTAEHPQPQHHRHDMSELIDCTRAYLPSMQHALRCHLSSDAINMGIRRLRCSILEPQSNTGHMGGNSLSFLSSVPYDLSVRALVRHWQDCEYADQLKVMIRLPDGQNLTYPITKIWPQDDGHVLSLVECDVELEIDEGWSEASQVLVQIVRQIEFDRVDTDSCLRRILFSGGRSVPYQPQQYLSLQTDCDGGVSLMIHPMISRQ